MRESVPSCMRAPPEEEQTITGVRVFAPSSMARVTFSPTTEPMLPPRNVKSRAHITTGYPPIVPVPYLAASDTPDFSRLSAMRAL